MHERRTESARSAGKRSEGSEKSPGIGGADRRAIVPPVHVRSTFSGLVSVMVRVPGGGNSLESTGGDSWGSSNNESGLSSPSLKASASSWVVARKWVTGGREDDMSALQTRCG
jgi:hypothetical protein